MFREYGHMVTRMGIERKVIVGHWADKKVQERLASWMRTAVGIMESSHIHVCRVADNMRNVAVTEGDKVEAQIKFGWEVDAYPVNEIAEYVNDVSKGDIDALVEEYYNKYDILSEGRDPEEFKRHVAVQAGIEIGFEKFLEEKNYQAIVTHFGDLGVLKQLPGLAIQRLMEKGYGFGGSLQVEHIILPLLMILQPSRWVTGLQQCYTLTKILQSVASRMSFAGMKLRFVSKNA